MKVEKLRLAHIGAGGMGRGDISTTGQHPGVEIAVLCDVDSVRAEEMLKKYDSAKKYTDYREMIAKEKGNIDAVFVSIPDHNHAAASMAAAVTVTVSRLAGRSPGTTPAPLELLNLLKWQAAHRRRRAPTLSRRHADRGRA